jgi:hypothetical protein
LNVPNQAFRNRGDLTFEPAGAVWGFNAVGISHGMALADLDSDGDLDLVVNNLNAAADVYRNDTSAPRVAVRLKGKVPNTRGIGAKLKLEGGPIIQTQEMISGGRYASSDDAERIFAAGSATGLVLTVTWRSGAVSVVSNISPNTICEVDEPVSVQTPNSKLQGQERQPLFRDVSAALAYLHHDEAFDDFARQPLLSKRISQSGPGISWADIDGDKHDDLIVGSGRGGDLAFMRNVGDGKFRRARPPQLLTNAREDQTTILAWSAVSGSTTLLVGQSSYETSATNNPAALQFETWAGGIDAKEGLPGQRSSTGPMSLADVDGDGDLDLFIGGQVNPGRYPEPATSRLYRNDGGSFVLAQEFTGVGLVNGAMFSDLNGDGFPELVLACDWGPLKFFRNDHGKFDSWNPAVRSLHSQPSTLNDLRGWWNGVAAGDFDGDGQMDIVASNWGRNSPYQSFLGSELRIYFGDFAGTGGIEGVEAYVENGRVVRGVIPTRWPERCLGCVENLEHTATTQTRLSVESWATVCHRRKNCASIGWTRRSFSIAAITSKRARCQSKRKWLRRSGSVWAISMEMRTKMFFSHRTFSQRTPALRATTPGAACSCAATGAEVFPPCLVKSAGCSFTANSVAAVQARKASTRVRSASPFGPPAERGRRQRGALSLPFNTLNFVFGLN